MPGCPLCPSPVLPQDFGEELRQGTSKTMERASEAGQAKGWKERKVGVSVYIFVVSVFSVMSLFKFITSYYFNTVSIFLNKILLYIKLF
jgi:hypothetical protein